MSWGSYPMVPYAGRVRRGRFQFDRQEWRLPITLGAHAIHGTVYDQPWAVLESTSTSCTLRCPLGPDWPFGGWATQEYTLAGDSFTCELALHTAERPMPAQVGWHPWFVKPDSLTFRPGAMYHRDDEGMPDGALVPVPDGPWDDCFARVEQPIVLRWDDLELEVRSDCDVWVVYDEPRHATCVEPQSGPPDGFTLDPVEVSPDLPLRRWMRWTWHLTSG